MTGAIGTGPARLTRIIADGAGGTRFEDGEVPLTLGDFAPPAPPMLRSEPQTATAVRFVGATAGWDSPPHPAPARQYVVMLRGRVRATVTDGTSRTFGPGDVVLLEDTSGEGHRTFVPEDEDWLAMVVVLERS
jgi:quercetin dioxygenase-like cupin family protein